MSVRESLVIREGPQNIEEWSHSLGFAYVGNLEWAWPEKLGQHFEALVTADRMASTVAAVPYTGITGQLGANGYRRLYDRLPRSLRTDPPAAEFAQSDVFIIMLGLADLATYDPATYTNALANTLRAAIARIRCSRVYEETDATVTNGGTGGNHSTSSSAGYYSGGSAKTLALADGASWWDIAVPSDFGGGTVVLGGMSLAVAAQTQRAEVRLNPAGANTLHGNWDSNYTTDSVPAQGSPNIYRVTGLPSGAQTIRVKTRTGNNNLILDWWGVESLDPPLVVLPLQPKCPTYSFFASGWTRVPTDAEVDTMNASFRTIASELGPKVICPDLDAAFNKNTNYFKGIDSIHWTEQGSMVAEEVIEQSIERNLKLLPKRPMVPPRKRPLQNKNLIAEFSSQIATATTVPTAISLTTLSNSVARVVPFQLAAGMYVNRIFVSTPATGTGTMECGIFDDMGVQVYSSGAVTGAANITTISIASPMWLPANQYYWALTARTTGTQTLLVTPVLSAATLPRWGTIAVSSGTLPVRIRPEQDITKTVGGFPAYVTLSEWT